MNLMRYEESTEEACLQLPQNCLLKSYQGVWLSLPRDLSSADKLGQSFLQFGAVCQNEFKENALNKPTC